MLAMYLCGNHLQRDFLAEKSKNRINDERLQVYCGAAELCIRFIYQFVVYIYASWWRLQCSGLYEYWCSLRTHCGSIYCLGAVFFWIMSTTLEFHYPTNNSLVQVLFKCWLTWKSHTWFGWEGDWKQLSNHRRFALQRNAYWKSIH